MTTPIQCAHCGVAMGFAMDAPPAGRLACRLACARLLEVSGPARALPPTGPAQQPPPHAPRWAPPAPSAHFPPPPAPFPPPPPPAAAEPDGISIGLDWLEKAGKYLGG